MEIVKTKGKKESERQKKIEYRKLISLMRTEDYGFDLGKEVYVGANDIFKNYLKKIS